MIAGREQLIESELEALYRVSRVLNRSLHLQETLTGVLEQLHEFAGMQRGMVSLLDPDTGELTLTALYHGNQELAGSVRYQPGEGIVGAIIDEGLPIVVRRVSDEPRFLDRLGLYDEQLPFIGVPILSGQSDILGVLAAQPDSTDAAWLSERARFLEMVANLIARSVILAREVQQEQQDITDERDQLRRQVRGNYGFDNIIGSAAPMRRVFEQVRQVAKWNSTVLIRGESGTGKELIANAIHYNSLRASGTFVKLNCAALPDNLLESELFGHEKGAFTGAVNQRKGRFEQAHGGTLFLDEIGEISPAFQAKLLRVLQEGEFERVGGNRTLKVDVRVIAATNRNLEDEVARGEFREDLYYRLNVMPLFMPPLSDRAEDIPELARFFVKKIGRKQGRELSITDSAIRLLMQHDWPGNVRELENTLERGAIMSAKGVIDCDVVTVGTFSARPVASQASVTAAVVDLNDSDIDERGRVIAALEQAGWVQAKAARLLGMTPRQIAYRVQILGIRMRRL